MSCHRVCLAAISRNRRTASPPAPLGGLQVTWRDLTYLDLHCLYVCMSPLFYNTHTLTYLRPFSDCYSVAVRRGGVTTQHTACHSFIHSLDEITGIMVKDTFFWSISWSTSYPYLVQIMAAEPLYFCYLSTQPTLFISSIVWSTSVTQSRHLCGLSDEEFLSELNTALQRPSEVDRWSPLYTGNNVSIIVT